MTFSKPLTVLACICFCVFHTTSFAKATPYSLEIRNAPVIDVLRMLAEMEGKNIVLSDKLEGTISGSFSAVNLNQALSSVLDANDLGSVTEGNVIRISTKKQLEGLGRDLTTITVNLKYAKAKEVALILKPVMSLRGSIAVGERSNSLIIRDTDAPLQAVRAVIESIDKLDQAVLIEAKIVDVSENFSLNLGTQWGISNTTGRVSVGGANAVGTADSGRNLISNPPVANPLAGIAMAMGPFANTFIDAQITAAEAKGDAHVLSRPSMVTLNHEPATIRSGTKFNVKTSGSLNFASAGVSGSSNTLQEIDTGITLVATPHIVAGNKINLSINVTQSSPDFGKAVDGIPAINDNSVTTTVLLEDGETTVIGGLLQSSNSNGTKGIPGLSRIPILGVLFGSISKDTTKRELLIIMRPKIVQGAVTHLPGFTNKTAEAIKPDK